MVDQDINGFEKLLSESIDHPAVFFLFLILVGINILDVITTRIALTDLGNMEGNPFMAPLLPYAPIVKFIYLLVVFVIADYLEHRKSSNGEFFIVVNCIITGMIVVNNILVINGIYLL